jgi:RNA polymerase sigma-70 factor (ECF subfamily)
LAGDARAERELFELHVDSIYRTAFRMSGDPDVAADHTQEVFIKAFANLAQFRGEASLRSWMRAITASVVLNSRRRRETVGRVVIDLEMLHDPGRSAIAERHSLRDRLQLALERLPRKLRDTLLMHDFEGYTHTEIASALNIPVGTSKARVTDARSRLRKILNAQEHHE